MCHLRCSLEFDLTFSFKCNVVGVYVSIVSEAKQQYLERRSSYLSSILKAIVEILITRFATNNGALSVLPLCRSTSFCQAFRPLRLSSYFPCVPANFVAKGENNRETEAVKISLQFDGFFWGDAGDFFLESL